MAEASLSGSKGPRERRVCHAVEYRRLEYTSALDLQRRLVAARHAGLMEKDVFIFLEHPPVFTLGRRGGLENLKVSPRFLERRGIPVVRTERGGDITYHGPGQLVVYPILDLGRAGLGVADYVNALEEVLILAASEWGVQAGRNRMNRGVWIGSRKLASVGIRVRRGISFHGMALNVNLRLEPFSWIRPCGLVGTRMTSLKRECAGPLHMPRVRDAIKSHMEAVFGIRLEPANPNEIPGPF
jgi:lipoate-protein ligase B